MIQKARIQALQTLQNNDAHKVRQRLCGLETLSDVRPARAQLDYFYIQCMPGGQLSITNADAT